MRQIPSLPAAWCFAPWAHAVPAAGLPWHSPMRHVLVRKDPLGASDALALWQDRLPPAVRRSVTSRQYEFLLGRLAAHCVLRAWGAPAPAACGIRERRPVWPDGFAGSISHTQALVVAIAAPLPNAGWSVGTDLEALPACDDAREALAACLSPAERRLLADVDQGHVLAFSAKESLYKCLSPQVPGLLDFHDAAVIAIDPVAGQLVLQLQCDLPPPGPARGTRFAVRFRLLGDHVWTGVEHHFGPRP